MVRENRLVPYIGRELGNQPALRDRLIEATDNTDTTGWSATDMINFVTRAVREIRRMDPVELALWVGGGATGATHAILTGGDILTSTAYGATTGRSIANAAGFTPQTAPLTQAEIARRNERSTQLANEYANRMYMEAEDYDSMVQRELDISREIMTGMFILQFAS